MLHFPGLVRICRSFVKLNLVEEHVMEELTNSQNNNCWVLYLIGLCLFFVNPARAYASRGYLVSTHIYI